MSCRFRWVTGVVPQLLFVDQKGYVTSDHMMCVSLSLFKAVDTLLGNGNGNGNGNGTATATATATLRSQVRIPVDRHRYRSARVAGCGWRRFFANSVLY